MSTSKVVFDYYVQLFIGNRSNKTKTQIVTTKNVTRRAMKMFNDRLQSPVNVTKQKLTSKLYDHVFLSFSST